jgi:Zn finger protein HypA/HybF involved in hydrogenase expression
MAEGYCVKCKAKREMQDAKEVEMNAKGGGKRAAMTGVCPNCGTKMFKILGKKK